MFSALHELLVDDLAGVVLAGLDVDGLFDDGVGAAPEGLARPVLGRGRYQQAGRRSRRAISPGRGPSRGP